MGLGMCLVVAPSHADAVAERIAGARVVGEVRTGVVGVSGV
jgi:phosphoribosylaminoimidazole (AIR) synthetase